MITHIKSTDEFLNETSSGKVLVDFFATWCGPCNMLTPLLEEISNDIKVLKVDVDEFNDLAIQFGISSIPCLFLFNNGEIVKKTIGYMNKDQLLNFIKD